MTSPEGLRLFGLVPPIKSWRKVSLAETSFFKTVKTNRKTYADDHLIGFVLDDPTVAL